MVKYYNGEMFRIPQAFEDEVRADERAKAIDECLAIVQKIKDDYNEAKSGERVPINYGTICGIIIKLERLKGAEE